MGVPKLLELTFLPAPDDNPLHSPEYQKGLRSLADALEAEGGVSVEIELMDGPSGGNQATYSGVFTMDGVSVQVNRGIIAWLKDHSGRQVRVGVGPVGRRPTAEAQNCEDVERLLTKAGEYIDIMREISAKDTGERNSPRRQNGSTADQPAPDSPGPDGPPIGDLAYQRRINFLGSLSIRKVGKCPALLNCAGFSRRETNRVRLCHHARSLRQRGTRSRIGRIGRLAAWKERSQGQA